MAPSESQRKVFVFGLPRSGTSWVARVLSETPGFTYYREPDNYDHMHMASRRFATLRLDAADNDQDFHQFMEKVLNGAAANDFTMQASCGVILRKTPKTIRQWMEPLLYPKRRRDRVVIKFIRAIFTIPWVARHYPDAKIIYVYRHPCGQFHSWRGLGWTPNPAHALRELHPSSDLFRADLDVLAQATTYWEKAGAFWAITNGLARSQVVETPSAALIPFEWLCRDPLQNFRQLFTAFDLPWNSKIERFVQSTNQRDKHPYSVKREAIAQIDNWRERVTPHEIEDCRRFAELVAPSFYRKFSPRHPNTLILPEA